MSEDLLEEGIYEILFNTVIEGLLIINQDGVICLHNPRARELFGYSSEELTGLHLRNLIPKSARNRHKEYRESYQAAPVKRPMGMGMQLSAVRKDGSEFPVEISLNHFETKGNRYTLTLITDITVKKHYNDELVRLNKELEFRVLERTKELKASEELYKLTAQNFPNGIISVFDKDLNYIFVEGKELQGLGLEGKNLIGTPFLDKFDSKDHEALKQKMQEAFSGSSCSCDITLNDNTYQINAVPLLNEFNEIDKVLVVELNVSEQKLVEDKIRNALNKERELSELKSRFVSMASHEFRTPLSTILSSIGLIDKYIELKKSEKTHKHIDRIRSSVKNLTETLNDFLSLDKLETGIITKNPISFNIVTFFNNVIDEQKINLKKEQRFIFNYTSNDEDTVVTIDVNILKNVLYNLFSNASKYSEEGKDIFIDLILDNENISIKVRDQGMGIPLKEQQHLFTRFFRANNAINIQGTGLGLNIVKKYIDLLEGSISFESKEGKGTTFTVTLPRENK